MELRRFKPGDTLLLHDGARAEVLSPTQDGWHIWARYVDVPADPSLVGEEDLVTHHAVAAFTLAPVGPEWDDKVVVVVHHVPESEESEAGYEVVTMNGVPLGVTITAGADTAQEALDLILGALAAFGYSGKVIVEDATYIGGVQRYETEAG